MTFTIFTDLECNHELQRWQHLHSLSINVTISIVRILFLKHFKAFNSIKEISMTPRACKRDNHEDFLLGKKRQQQTVIRGDSQAGDGDARQVEEGVAPLTPPWDPPASSPSNIELIHFIAFYSLLFLDFFIADNRWGLFCWNHLEGLIMSGFLGVYNCT